MVRISGPILETSLLVARNLATPEDDWPEFNLTEVEITTNGPSHQPSKLCSLLEAGENNVLKVVGRLESLGDDQKQYLKRTNIKNGIRIELPPVVRFAYGQYDDGEVVFWVLGHGGWFRISPSTAYQNTYNEMVEGLRVFYFVADTFRPTTRGRNPDTPSKPVQKRIEDVFRKFVKAEPVIAPDEDTAEQLCYKHRRFLIWGMKVGKENIDWRQSSLWKHLEQHFPEEFRDSRATSEANSSTTEASVAPVRGKRRRSQIDISDTAEVVPEAPSQSPKRRRSRQLPPPPPKKHSRQVVQAMGKLQGPEALWRVLFVAISHSVLPKRRATLHDFATLLSQEYDITPEAATNYCVFHAVDLVSLMQLCGTTPVVWTRLPLYKNLAVSKLTDAQKHEASKTHLSIRPTASLIEHMADFDSDDITNKSGANADMASVAGSDLMDADSDIDQSEIGTPRVRESDGHKTRSGLRLSAGKGFRAGSGKRFTGQTARNGRDSSIDPAAAAADVDLLLSWQAGTRPSQSALVAAAVSRVTSSPQPGGISQPGTSSDSQRTSRRLARRSRLEEPSSKSGTPSRVQHHGSFPMLESTILPSPSTVAMKGANSPGDVWKCQSVGCPYVVYLASSASSIAEIRAHTADHIPHLDDTDFQATGRKRGKGKSLDRRFFSPIIRDGEDGDEPSILENDSSSEDPIEDDLDGPMSGLVRMVRKESRGRLPVSYLITRIRDLAGGPSATAAATAAILSTKGPSLPSSVPEVEYVEPKDGNEEDNTSNMDHTDVMLDETLDEVTIGTVDMFGSNSDHLETEDNIGHVGASAVDVTIDDIIVLDSSAAKVQMPPDSPLFEPSDAPLEAPPLNLEVDKLNDVDMDMDSPLTHPTPESTDKSLLAPADTSEVPVPETEATNESTDMMDDTDETMAGPPLDKVVLSGVKIPEDLESYFDSNSPLEFSPLEFPPLEFPPLESPPPALPCIIQNPSVGMAFPNPDPPQSSGDVPDHNISTQMQDEDITKLDVTTQTTEVVYISDSQFEISDDIMGSILNEYHSSSTLPNASNQPPDSSLIGKDDPNATNPSSVGMASQDVSPDSTDPSSMDTISKNTVTDATEPATDRTLDDLPQDIIGAVSNGKPDTVSITPAIKKLPSTGTSPLAETETSDNISPAILGNAHRDITENASVEKTQTISTDLAFEVDD